MDQRYILQDWFEKSKEVADAEAQQGHFRDKTDRELAFVYPEHKTNHPLLPGKK
jgi:hypothetical protein